MALLRFIIAPSRIGDYEIRSSELIINIKSEGRRGVEQVGAVSIPLQAIRERPLETKRLPFSPIGIILSFLTPGS